MSRITSTRSSSSIFLCLSGLFIPPASTFPFLSTFYQTSMSFPTTTSSGFAPQLPKYATTTISRILLSYIFSIAINPFCKLSLSSKSSPSSFTHPSPVKSYGKCMR
ncbi:hypothetical protein ACMFMG_012231 [Clarireedia jacksonii]